MAAASAVVDSIQARSAVCKFADKDNNLGELKRAKAAAEGVVDDFARQMLTFGKRRPNRHKATISTFHDNCRSSTKWGLSLIIRCQSLAF